MNMNFDAIPQLFLTNAFNLAQTIARMLCGCHNMQSRPE